MCECVCFGAEVGVYGEGGRMCRYIYEGVWVSRGCVLEIVYMLNFLNLFIGTVSVVGGFKL